MTYIVILAYNEDASLAGLIAALAQALGGLPHRFVVVDDGSQDRTAEVARGLAASHPVTLLQHPVNLGVAKAFDTGLRHSAGVASPGDAVVTIEGDKTNDPALVPVMTAKLAEGFDVVCASRYLQGGSYVGFPAKRHVLSLGANTLARLFFRVPGVRDYTIFFRAYRAEVLQKAIAKHGDRFIECKGFASNAEILVKVAQAVPIRCAEVPMVYRYDLKKSKSTMRIWSNLKEYGRLFWLSLAR